MEHTYGYLNNVWKNLKQENSKNPSLIFIIVVLCSIPLGYAINSISIALLLFVSLLNFKKRNYSAAADNYTSVINFGFIDKHTEYNTLLKRGTCYYHMNNFDEAEKDITSSMDYIKNDSEPLIMLSAIYIKKKNFNM